MSSPETWPSWQPHAEDPSQGGMSQIAAYDAGLTGDPGCWTQKIEVYQDARLDPPEFVDRVAWEEPSPAEYQAMAEAPPPQPGPDPGPDPGYEPELPF